MSGQHGIDGRLQAMRALRFEFATDQGRDGSIEALVGVRVHHGVIDVFELYGEDEATATRLPGSEPDIAFARTVLWHTRGTAYEVIDELLSLPDPGDDRSAPAPRSGVRVPPGTTIRRTR